MSDVSVSKSGTLRIRATRLQVVLAFAAVYVLWGSTYLGIRFSMETLPAFTTQGVRFFLSGVVMYAWARSKSVQIFMDRIALRAPVFGDMVRKATVARWTRTLATMFAAGVPLVEALDSVAGAAGNHEYYLATKKIQAEVSTGSSLTVSMQNVEMFPNMVLQMVAIGEEAGSLDGMLSKVADFFEAEVDDAVDALSSLMEPLIMVVLGTLIGGMVIAMYLPIFKLGQAV